MCEALAHKPVRVEIVEGRLLVSYRHVYVRGIDRERRVSRALVLGRGGLARPSLRPSGLPKGLNDPNVSSPGV